MRNRAPRATRPGPNNLSTTHFYDPVAIVDGSGRKRWEFHCRFCPCKRSFQRTIEGISITIDDEPKLPKMHGLAGHVAVCEGKRRAQRRKWRVGGKKKGKNDTKRSAQTMEAPSSAFLPSTPTRDRDSEELDRACWESTMRLRDAWAQLEQRYARPFEEDDIIDLREKKIVQDRGVIRGLKADISFGCISMMDEPGNDASNEDGDTHSGDEDDPTDPDSIDFISRKATTLDAQLRSFKPLCDLDTKDNDLRDFLEAERRARKRFGPIDEESEHQDFSRAGSIPLGGHWILGEAGPSRIPLGEHRILVG